MVKKLIKIISIITLIFIISVFPSYADDENELEEVVIEENEKEEIEAGANSDAKPTIKFKKICYL